MKSAASATPKKTKKRVRAVPEYRSFRLSKKRLKQVKPLPGVITLSKSTTKIIWQHKKLFIGIAVLYAVLSFVFVQGIGSTFQIAEVKANLDNILGTGKDRVGVTITLFSYLVGSAGSNAGDVSGAYQLFMVLILSLAVIWGVRQVQAGERPGIRDALYKGMYPLIPFMVVIFVMGLQLIPLLLGNLVYSSVLQNGLAVSLLEKAIWLLLFIALALLSGYMILSSIFSLYIVTLPDMRPIRALRSARELVLHRRFAISIRMIALPLVFVLVSAVIFVPLLLLLPQVVEILFLLTTSFWLVFAYIYTYLLYRELI